MLLLLMIPGLIFLFILFLCFVYFCKNNIFTKSISSLTAALVTIGGSKVSPGYADNFTVNSSLLTFGGRLSIGGERTDTTILLCVLLVTLVTLIGCYTFLRYKEKI